MKENVIKPPPADGEGVANIGAGTPANRRARARQGLRKSGRGPTLDRPARGAYDNNVPLHPKGGENMHTIIDFCLAVFSSVLGRLVWEWLEGVLHDVDNEQRH